MHIPTSKRLVCSALTALLGPVILTAVPPHPATAMATASNAAQQAVIYASSHGYRSAISVLDTQTGSRWDAGDAERTYAAESVMKVFIATRLLDTGQMSGFNASTAYTMITRSDDASADALYGRVGGDSLITWVAQTYRISDLGSPPAQAGWWGGTMITTHGLSTLYNSLRHDSRVWPWLSNAMHHATEYGSDGTYQFFGIPSATAGAAIKQGWGADDPAGVPEFNSTGFVNGDRYVVVILTQGPGYGAPISNMLTAEARLLMPGGRIENEAINNPIGHYDAASAIGSTVTVRGWAFDPNATSTAINVAIYRDGIGVGWFKAAGQRPDVDAAFKIAGAHGVDVSFTLGDGTHSVCLYAINIGAGTGNPGLGCATVHVHGAPIGHLDAVSASAGGVTLQGWAFDPDQPTAAIPVAVYDDAHGAWYPTGVARPDVNAAYQISGAHGFDIALQLSSGSHTLCTYAINTGPPASNPLLGCSTVSVS